jgi:hypothetical protein
MVHGHMGEMGDEVVKKWFRNKKSKVVIERKEMNEK